MRTRPTLILMMVVGLWVAAVGCSDDSGGSTDPSDEVDAQSDAAEDSSTTGEDVSTEDVFVEPDLPDYTYTGEPGPEDLFQHGVASGDPLTDRVILWTRVTPAEEAEVEVYYEVALQPDITQRVAAGVFSTNAARDYTVKVDPTGLPPGTTLYYRFQALGRMSPIGRTRTAATPDTALDRFRLAVVSCSNYTSGYFHGYRQIGQRADLDLVIHLGDYIYEYGSSNFRPSDPPNEITTLEDYRLRYAQYRSDPDLQEAHRQHPWIVVWDDHESADNSWRDGASNHTPIEEGDWETRLNESWQAWSEWQPVRDQEPLKIWRSFRFGDLVDLFMLDTRIWGRELQLAVNLVEDDLSRQLLGSDQEAWLIDQLGSASARW
ncbi:MAG: alkaline phosphatase D family protein, partial [Myxococcota bacterium]